MERKDLLIKLGNELFPKKERRRRKPRRRYTKCAKRKKIVVRKKQEKTELNKIKAKIVEYQKDGRHVLSNNIIKKENEGQQETIVLTILEPCVTSPKKTISIWTLFRFPLTLWRWWK